MLFRLQCKGADLPVGVHSHRKEKTHARILDAVTIAGADTVVDTLHKREGLHRTHRFYGGGKPVLLMHGDLLCSDDTAYQAFRAQTRDPRWQGQFLSQPLAARLAFAQQARAASKAHQSGLQSQGAMETITDATPATVADTFSRYGIDRIIHGHTHRPRVHRESSGGTRIVLGDWYEQGSVLRVDPDGFELASL